jgi:hypothetical protein
MRHLTDGLQGVIARPAYRIEVWKTSSAPKQNGAIPEGDYFYLTKIHFNGEIGERSIGLPASDMAELLAIMDGRITRPA